MAAIKNELEAIKSARFGEEVRWAFHDGMFKINDQVVNAENSTIKNAASSLNSANNAAKSATASEQSAQNAKTSEQLAKQYMEQALSTTPDGYNANMELLAHMDIQTNTDLTLYGSKDGGVKLNHMVCRTEQKQYDGRNMFDKSTATDGYGISTTGKPYVAENYSYSDYINVTSGNTYSFQNIKWHNIYDADKNVMSTSNTITTYTIPDGAAYLRLTFETVNKDIVQMELGPEITDYEPYVGNAPSPNPAFHQSLNHTGDCVEMVQGYYSNGKQSPSNSSVCSKYKIPCKSGDIISFNIEKAYTMVVCYFKGTTFISNETSTNVTNANFTAPNGVDNFAFYISDINRLPTTPDTVGKIQLTVNGKYVHQIVETGKNHFDESLLLKASGWTLSNGWYSGKIGELHRLYNVNSLVNDFKENTSYTISLFYKSVTGNCNVRFEILYADGTNNMLIMNNSTESKVSVVSNAKKTIAKIIVSYGNPTDFCIKELQIKETDVGDDTYEPYTEHIATYYTSEPTREGDRFVNIDGLWNVERNSAEVVFDGNETWLYSSNLGNGLYRFANTSLKNIANYTDIHDVISDKFTVGGDTAYTCRFSADGELFVYMPGEALEEISNTGFKTWLAENPSIFQYKLATPVYETLDTASQIALNSLKSFNGCTYIEIDSRVQPSEISLDYGTSRVGAMALQSMNDNLIDYVERMEMKKEIENLTAMVLELNQE